MTPAEFRAVRSQGSHRFAGLVSRVEQVHQVITRRVLTAVGPTCTGVRIVHDRVAHATCLEVQGTGATAGVAGGQAGFVLGGGMPTGSHRAGNLALAALNAAVGDRLGGHLAPLAIQMAVRVAGRDVALTGTEVSATFPDAEPRIAVFMHGLAQTEGSWRRRASRSEPYGDRLLAGFGYTPVYVRYNTGKHIADSGRDLARLLDLLLAAWPVKVDEILLAGHSMGGLVIRSACHYGQETSADWTERVRHVFYLGSPHLGAPLAHAAALASRTLSQMPGTRPFATLAAGPPSVQNLRHGHLLDSDWTGCDLDGCQADHRRDAPLLATASHYAISATVTTDPGSPLGAIVGDLLVRPASAHGRSSAGQHMRFPIERTRELGGMHHFDLLNHPEVWEAMRGLLHAAAP